MSETGRVINTRPALYTRAVGRAQTASYTTMAAFIMAALTFLLLDSDVDAIIGVATVLAGLSFLFVRVTIAALREIEQPGWRHSFLSSGRYARGLKRALAVGAFVTATSCVLTAFNGAHPVPWAVFAIILFGVAVLAMRDEIGQATSETRDGTRHAPIVRARQVTGALIPVLVAGVGAAGASLLALLALKMVCVGTLSLVVISTGLLTGLAGIEAISSFSVAVALQPVKEPPDGHLG